MIRYLLLAFVLLTGTAQAQITKTFGFSENLGVNAGTTAAQDTTGTNLIVISVEYYNAVNPLVLDSDTGSNTWTALTIRTNDYISGRLYFCINPTTNASHTFTFTGNSTYSSVSIMGFSGVDSYDSKESGAGTFGATLQPGSLTPSADGALVITGSSVDDDDATVESISNGITTVDNQVAGISGQGGRSAIAYVVQGTAAAINPQWSGATKRRTAQMAVFLPSAGGSSNPNPITPSIPGGTPDPLKRGPIP